MAEHRLTPHDDIEIGSMAGGKGDSQYPDNFQWNRNAPTPGEIYSPIQPISVIMSGPNCGKTLSLDNDGCVRLRDGPRSFNRRERGYYRASRLGNIG